MLVSFNKRFIIPIENGSKKFTCRKRRKNVPKPGETMHMYTGSRFKPQLVSREKTLFSTQDLDLTITWELIDGKRTDKYKVEIKVDGKRLLPSQKKLFYEYDGFVNELDFVGYWTNNGKKSICEEDMVIFHWTDFKF